MSKTDRKREIKERKTILRAANSLIVEIKSQIIKGKVLLRIRWLTPFTVATKTHKESTADW